LRSGGSRENVNGVKISKENQLAALALRLVLVSGSGGESMREFLAAILTVIAMGVLLIAYTLSGSRAAAAGAGGGFVQYDPRGDAYMLARPAVAEPVNWTGDPYAVRAPGAYPSNRPAPGYVAYGQPAPSAQRSSTSASPRRSAQRERGDWKQTAMIVGGSTAAGAGIGGVIGGKKGALVGAAIGGGASTLYEATKR